MILEHGQAGEYRWGLRFAANPMLDDLLFRPTSQIDVAVEDYLTAGRACLAGDNIQQRRFACAVWSDQKAQFALLDRKIQPVQHLKAIKADADTPPLYRA